MINSLLTNPFAAAALTLIAIAVVLWLASLILRDASIVDLFWGPIIALATAVAFAASSGSGLRKLVVLSLVVVWAARLSVYLAHRNLGHGEDRRYVAFRERFGDRFWLISLGYVFLFQAAVAWVVALPLLAVMAQAGNPGWGWLDGLGLALFFFGLTYETVADLQLARFKRGARDETAVLDSGLWRYCRHPNYFGEFVLWWGLGLFGLAADAWWSVVGPALLTFLLLRVSGVAMLERTIGNRRPAYDDYRRRTNAFIPGRPRAA